MKPPDPDTVNRAMQIIGKRLDHVEYLTGYEGDAFASTGNLEEDPLSITAVHPMREEAVQELVSKSGGDRAVLQRLVDQGRLLETEYEGRKFCLHMRPCAHDAATC